MIKKHIVHSHFNRHSKSYDSHAIIQKKIALETAGKVGETAFRTVFEFGSGTGELTQKLVPYCSDKYECLDISSSMNEILKSKLNSEKIICYENDIEHWRFVNTYDLITSSSTLQWVENKRDVILRCLNALNDNGQLVLSFFNGNTFKEFHSVYTNVTGKPYLGSPDMPNATDIQRMVMNLPGSFTIEEKDYFVEIDGLRSFFKRLKSIGANNGSKVELIRKSEWQSIFNMYDTTIVKNGKPYIRYGVTYLCATK